MFNVNAFKGLAKIYSVIWLLFSITDARRVVRFGDARQREIDSIIEDWAFAKKWFSNPTLIPFIFICTWVLLLLIDVLGVVLLLQFVEEPVVWFMLLLAVIFFSGIVFRSIILFNSLGYISDTETLRIYLEQNLDSWKARWITAARIARVIVAIAFLYIMFS